MTIDNDAANLPALTDSPGIDDSTEASRGWDHIGAIIVDATLQRRQNYHATVKPRVVALVAAWPDAATTSGFRRRLGTGKLSEVISWPSPGRLAQVEDMTCVFETSGHRDGVGTPRRARRPGQENGSPGGPRGRAACQSQDVGLHRHPEWNLHKRSRGRTGTRSVIQAGGISDLCCLGLRASCRRQALLHRSCAV